MIGVADDAHGVVTSIGQQAFEEQGDLAVAPGDDDSHAPIEPGCPARALKDGKVVPGSPRGAIQANSPRAEMQQG
ncbi:hypothetical protein GCM10022256_10960 [Frondihabitans peucedani]|uniref:Uncharacterized protein n=1 Tax=Frondihabitans peucedani TaxID=598626 RepID=A0ABP8DZV8_9MICO